MFSNQPRKIYRRNQLIEVICQLRFPEILKIEAHEPADFQDAIRQAYPQYGKSSSRCRPRMWAERWSSRGRSTIISSFPLTARGRSA